MSKRLVMTAGLVGLMLAGATARADSQDQRAHRNLRNLFGLVVESLRDGQEESVAVMEVLPGGPASRAGLKEGDVIRRLGRRPIEDFRDLVSALGRLPQGERLSMQVERDGRNRTLSLMPRRGSSDDEDREDSTRYGRANGNGEDTMLRRFEQRFRRLESRLQEMEDQGQYGQERGEQPREVQRLLRRLDQLEQRVQQAQRSSRYGRTNTGMALGVQVREWRRESNSRQGGSAEQGVEVTAVEAESPAAKAGLRRGDIIIRANDREVSTQQDLRQAMRNTDSGEEATLEFLRGSRQMVRNVRMEGGAPYGGSRDRQYERLQQRVEDLEKRVREMENDR